MAVFMDDLDDSRAWGLVSKETEYSATQIYKW